MAARPDEKGLHVEVYRSVDFPDCTLGGVTSKHGRCLLLGVDGPTSVEENNRYSGYPVLRIVRHPAVATRLYAVPVDVETSGPGRMQFGGNFVYSCDSRFRQVCMYPIPVHDRDASKEWQ